MQERCRLISESQWREYQELVTKYNKMADELDACLVALHEYVKIYGVEKKCHEYLEKYGVEK
jgi:hypothetical protein